MVWETLHATQRAKDRSIQEYLETPSKYSMLVQFEARSRKTCNITKHGHMQSFSAIHCLQLALRKRSVRKKLRTSSTRRFVGLQDCQGLYSNRTGNAVNKIHEAKTQDHLGTHQAIRKVTYHFRQSNSRIQHVKTRSRS